MPSIIPDIISPIPLDLGNAGAIAGGVTSFAGGTREAGGIPMALERDAGIAEELPVAVSGAAPGCAAPAAPAA